MHPNEIYHVYNRGNNRQTIFYTRENYLYFLRKVQKYLFPVCDILAYCLMPNHFHFLIKTDARTVFQVARSNREIAISAFSRGLKIMLSSYAQAIQRQENMTGSLFQQKTKRKKVSSETVQEDYTLICFRYILQNPLKAGLVKRLDDWEFSSYPDLVNFRNGTLCDISVIRQELRLDWNTMEELIGNTVSADEANKIW